MLGEIGNKSSGMKVGLGEMLKKVDVGCPNKKSEKEENKKKEKEKEKSEKEKQKQKEKNKGKDTYSFVQKEEY